MALQWDWNKKSGTVTQVYGGKEYTSNFYEGNALMIVTNEFEEDGVERYNVIWFFTGKDHAERCLGLQECDDGTKTNMFERDGMVTRLVIYKEHCRQWQTLIDLFTKAIPEIVIELRAKAPDKEGGADDGVREKDA